MPADCAQPGRGWPRYPNTSITSFRSGITHDAGLGVRHGTLGRTAFIETMGRTIPQQ